VRWFDGLWLVRLLFLRGLAAIYLVAFISALNQFPALLGERGLLPVREFLDAVRFRDAPSGAGLRRARCDRDAAAADPETARHRDRGGDPARLPVVRAVRVARSGGLGLPAVAARSRSRRLAGRRATVSVAGGGLR